MTDDAPRFFADGVHDDGPALQCHLDAGKNLGDLPAGRYLIQSDVRVTEPLVVVGGMKMTGQLGGTVLIEVP